MLLARSANESFARLGVPVATSDAPSPSELRQPRPLFADASLPHGQPVARASPAHNVTPDASPSAWIAAAASGRGPMFCVAGLAPEVCGDPVARSRSRNCSGVSTVPVRALCTASTSMHADATTGTADDVPLNALV